MYSPDSVRPYDVSVEESKIPPITVSEVIYIRLQVFRCEVAVEESVYRRGIYEGRHPVEIALTLLMQGYCRPGTFDDV